MINGQNLNCIGGSGPFRTHEREIKCEIDGRGGCGECDFIFAQNTELFNCGEDLSCVNLNALFQVRDDFLLECSGKQSCLANRNSDRAISISCANRSIKGIKCGDEYSCQNQRFFILATSQPCYIEKIECDGDYSCQGAIFEFIGDIIVDEFNCGGTHSCHNLICNDPIGFANCPN